MAARFRLKDAADRPQQQAHTLPSLTQRRGQKNNSSTRYFRMGLNPGASPKARSNGREPIKRREFTWAQQRGGTRTEDETVYRRDSLFVLLTNHNTNGQIKDMCQTPT